MISGSAQRQQQSEVLSGAIAAHAAGHSTEAGAGAAAALAIFEQPVPQPVAGACVMWASSCCCRSASAAKNQRERSQMAQLRAASSGWAVELLWQL